MGMGLGEALPAFRARRRRCHAMTLVENDKPGPTMIGPVEDLFMHRICGDSHRKETDQSKQRQRSHNHPDDFRARRTNRHDMPIGAEGNPQTGEGR